MFKWVCFPALPVRAIYLLTVFSTRFCFLFASPPHPFASALSPNAGFPGTKKFVESLGQSPGSADAMNLIGQFGVGFYSG